MAWLNRGIAIAALALVAGALVLDVAIRNDPISVDFHTYLAAARTGIHDGWSHIYDQSLVATEQREVAPRLKVQPYLSPPSVAFLVTPLTALPYDLAYAVWAVLTLAAFAAALVLCATSGGLWRWVGVVGALGPWWVMHAVEVGQVVPLVAAGAVVGWRLLRDRRDVLAGLAFSTLLLKPNTALLVPVALLFAARYRALAAWLGAVAVVGLLTVAVLGPDGVAAYFAQLRGPLPAGADNVTLHGALGVSGGLAVALRLVIVAAVAAGAYLLRATPTLAIPLALVGSLLIAPYLHGSDLCVLSAAAWMVWEERPTRSWRAALGVAWLLASPYLYLAGRSPTLNRWPWAEIALLVALIIVPLVPLTARADSRRRAPA
jgi:hypothetical protein